ncbi:MAG: FtsX-like permease family protein [Pseudohongiellaceae bacterium]
MISHFTKMALKALFKFKLHSTISLLSLVFGFLCFISAVLLANYTDSFDQHFPNAEKIYNVIQINTDGTGPARFPIVGGPAARYLRAAFPDIPNISKTQSGGGDSDVTVDGEALKMSTRYVEKNFFKIFEMETIHGLATASELPPNSAIVTETAALRVWGRTDVVGERIVLENRDDIAIVGVTAKATHPSHLESSIPFFDTELFVPIELRDALSRERILASGGDPDADRWGNQSYYVYLEFPESMNVNVDDFNKQLDDFVNTFVPAERAESFTYELQPINQLVTSQMAMLTGGFSITDVLIVAGALVLLIGCINYSNLVIAQLSLRSQEIGVQKILGAKRSLIIFQYCYESFLFVLLALLLTLGVMAGLLFQLGAMNMIGVSVSMLFNPTLWMTLIPIIICVVLIAGGYPALRTATVSLVSMMRPKGSSGYSGRLRAMMVGTQFFISGTLMIMAVIMYLQNVAMTQQLDGELLDPKLAITIPIDTFTVSPELLTTQLKQNPAIVSVSQVDVLPWSISISGISLSREPDVNATTYEFSNQDVSYDFTETMNVPLLAGREFSRERSLDRFPSYSELTPGSGPYAFLIDDLTAQTLGWENAEAAVGSSVYRHIDPPTVETAFVTEFIVVGAVSSQTFQFIDFTSFGISGSVYTLRPESATFVIVKVAKDSINEALSHIDNTWNQLMPTIAIQREFLDDMFYDTYALFLSVSVSIGTLSVIGFLVASIGLLGNATFITNIRQKEVGIRKVMGASSGRLLRMLLLDFAKPIMIANAFAWPLGYVAGNLYVSFFATQASITALPFLVSFLLSVTIAFAAVASQSWKSAKIRPAMVLRYE